MPDADTPGTVTVATTPPSKAAATAGVAVGLGGLNLLYEPVMAILRMIHNAAPAILTDDLVTPQLGIALSSLIAAAPAYLATRSIKGTRTWVPDRNADDSKAGA